MSFLAVESDVDNPSNFILTEKGLEPQCFESETKEERFRRLARERKRKQRTLGKSKQNDPHRDIKKGIP
jgi:hypothetical protein